MFLRLLVLLSLSLVAVPSAALADAPDYDAIRQGFQRWRTSTSNLPLTAEAQLRKYLTEVHSDRLTYEQVNALARRIDGMAVPPFGAVGYEQQRNAHELSQIQARTNQLLGDIRAGRTNVRDVLPELKRLRAAATALSTKPPAIPATSIRIRPGSTVTTAPCRDRDTTVRTLFSLAEAARAAEQTVNLRENPSNISEVLRVLSSTRVGQRLLAGGRALRIGELTEAERKRRRLGADTQGVFVHGENAIFVRTDQEMGRVLLSLVQELAHMRDETLRTEQTEFARLERQARALGSGPEYDRLVARLNILAQRSVYRRELHAWRAEAELVAELSARYPSFEAYYRALVANNLANDLPPTGDDIVRIYELDRSIISAYLREP